MLLFFVTQYNSSLSSCVPNFRILTKVVAEKSLTENFFTDKHNYRKGKNYIPPIYFVPGGWGGEGGGQGHMWLFWWRFKD